MNKFYDFNLMAPGKILMGFKVILKLILVVDGWAISCKTILKGM